MRAIFMSLEAPEVTCSRSSGMTGSACRFTPSGWSAVASSGHLRPTVWLQSARRSWPMAGATLGEVAPTSALPLLPFAFTESKAVFAALDGALGDRIREELAQNG